MTARWAFAPVCGFDFWRVIVTSPEVLIFLFFMITDPKTVPAGRVGRVVFGLLVAVASTLLMAPQTNEFGTKVALLAGLVVVCAGRPVLDRLLPAAGNRRRRRRPVRGRLATGGRGCRPRRPPASACHCRRGRHRRRHRRRRSARPRRRRPRVDEVLDRVPARRSTRRRFPTITVEQDVVRLEPRDRRAGVHELVLTLAENLELESQALLRADATILRPSTTATGSMRCGRGSTTPRRPALTVVERYQIDDVNVTLLEPFGRQDGLSLGLESRGTVTEETYDADGRAAGAGASPFATTFVVRQAPAGGGSTSAVLPLEAGD